MEHHHHHQPVAKHIVVFRNGDSHYPGRRFIVNAKKTGSYDNFLGELTDGLQARFGAVRSVFTPGHGSRVEHLEQLQSGGVYVAAGRERFKKIDYAQIDTKVTKPRGKNGCPETLRANTLRDSEERRVTVSLSRIRHLVPEPLIIYVFVNGESRQAPVRLIVPRRVLASWERVLELVSQRVTLRSGVVRRLYSLEGLPLTHGSELQNGHGYVALGREPFQARRYGLDTTTSTTTPPARQVPHGRRLPPLQKQPAGGSVLNLEASPLHMVQANNGIMHLRTVSLFRGVNLDRHCKGRGKTSAAILQRPEPEKHAHPSLVGNRDRASAFVCRVPLR
ncbi:doublecortin domain-containing protein 2-like [Lampetra fluviatilis]